MQQAIKLKPFDVIHEGKYRIIRHIADGGEGYIYLAQNALAGNQVCIIKQMFQEPWELEGIEEDYQMFGGLFHPNIVQVFDFFWENDVFYIVMNYVAGNTMNIMLKQAKEPINELKALQWMSKLAHILDFLHSRPVPIIHADISPDNVIITPKGDLVIIDFGIARSTFEAIGMREFYSALEQVEEGILSPATDVYSLGATLYKCLTLKDQPEPGYDPRNHNPKISARVAELVKRCTAPKTSSFFGLIKGRYENMMDVIEAVSECYTSSDIK